MLDIILKRKVGISTFFKRNFISLCSHSCFPGCMVVISVKENFGRAAKDGYSHLRWCYCRIACPHNIPCVFLFHCVVKVVSTVARYDGKGHITHTAIFLRHKSNWKNLEPFFTRHRDHGRTTSANLYFMHSRVTLCLLRCPCTSYYKSMVVIDPLPNCSDVYTSRKILLKDLSRA